MVVLSRITTKTGDDGTSALANGERRPKTDPRFEAIGAVDELNAVIGLARIHEAAPGDPMAAMLARIQNDLFDLGATLAVPDAGTDGSARLAIADSQVARVEGEIETLNAALEPLRSFILPGGAPLAAAFHHCRVVARRAERDVLRLHEAEAVPAPVLQYLNRLSDFFFVAARAANDGGKADILWQPGANR